MARSADWKETGGICEWCTDLPRYGSPRKSPVFVLQGAEWYFQLAYKMNRYHFCYNLYLMQKHDLVKLPIPSVTIYVGFESGNNNTMFPYSQNRNSNLVWCIPADEINSNVSPNHHDSRLFRFCFVFPNVSSLRPHAKTVSVAKEVQTSPYWISAGNSCLENLSQDFNKLLDEQAGSDHDVKLKCGDRVIQAHRQILRSRSEVFAAMLRNDMAEERTGVVEIQDMDVDIFEDFIRYLYTGKLSELTIDKAKVLYEIGDKYAVRSLMQRCGEFLIDDLTLEKACEFLVLADAHSDQYFKTKVINYIVYREIPLCDAVWLDFCSKHPRVAVEVLNFSYKMGTKK